MADSKIPSIKIEVLDFLSTCPSAQQVLDFRASEGLQERLRYLLQQNKERTLTSEENAELDEMEYMDHLMAMLKAKIRIRMMEEK
ncbi:MAG: hypothetical protein K8L91_17375 [Anaerolineae bacterium]|nr:hypothetical protein [Anaerolineae bacterium]